MTIDIVAYDAQSPLLEQAVQLYVAIWGRHYEDSLFFFKEYATFRYFRGLVARDGEQVIGLAFGTLSQPGQWWHNQVAARVGYDHAALQAAWVLTELAVHEAYRRAGIGGRLHDSVIAGLPLRNLLLSTPVHNHGARRFYERRGWGYLHRGFTFQRGNPPYAIMHRPLSHA